MDDKLKAKVVEKIEELEIELILQEDRLEVLKTIQVSGDQAAALGQIVGQTQLNVDFSKQYLGFLKSKYCGKQEEKKEEK